MNSQELALLLSTVFGFIISVLFSFVPGLSDWYYGEVGKKYRGLIMMGIGALLSVGLYLFSCVWPIPIPGVELKCGTDGIVTLVMAFFAFLAANQATYLASPESPAKERVFKAQRERSFGA